MDTPLTRNSNISAGWILYDADCAMCSHWIHHLQTALTHRGFRLLPLQSPEASQRLHLSGPDLLHEMHLLLADGRHLGGADAIVEVARHIRCAWPLWLISQIPGLMPLLRALYRTIAANRMSISGACVPTAPPTDTSPSSSQPTSSSPSSPWSTPGPHSPEKHHRPVG